MEQGPSTLISKLVIGDLGRAGLVTDEEERGPATAQGVLSTAYTPSATTSERDGGDPAPASTLGLRLDLGHIAVGNALAAEPRRVPPALERIADRRGAAGTAAAVPESHRRKATKLASPPLATAPAVGTLGVITEPAKATRELALGPAQAEP